MNDNSMKHKGRGMALADNEEQGGKSTERNGDGSDIEDVPVLIPGMTSDSKCAFLFLVHLQE